jgi:hypothetical protein
MPGGRPKGDPNHHRRGTGAGWGGAAKGAGSKGAGPGRGNTHRTVAEIMAAQGAREKAAEAWMTILNDPAHPRHADMVAKAAERLDGAPKQEIEASIASHVIRAPAKPASAEEWAATYAPRAADE